MKLRGDIRIAHLDLGVIFTEQKIYADALASLKLAEKLEPEEPEAHYRLGRLYQAMGNEETANAEFAKVKQLHQKSEEDIADKMSGKPPAKQP